VILTKTYIFLLVILITGFSLNSCVTKTNYKALSYFFDGVPNPDSTSIKQTDSLLLTDANTTQIASKSIKKGSIHSPYEERECASCHDQDNQYKLVSKMPDLCYTCHDDFSDGKKFVHGPVASGYCTECHDAHSSKYETILKDNSQNLCYKCHVKSDVMKNDIHSDIDSTLCWTCHEPHSSMDRLLLK
jgi:predicted CXXCH cytochrome family protein